jgi:proline-specific peptidase
MGAGELVDVAGTRLFVDRRGSRSHLPLIVLHGGPGLDHHMFGDYLDPLAASGHCELVLVDQRGQGRSARDVDLDSLSIGQMAADVTELAAVLGFGRYLVLGHSYGSFVALQQAIEFPADRGGADGTVVSAGVPASRWLAGVDAELTHFEPAELRERVTSSWARERDVDTDAAADEIWIDQLPFHFADPRDPRIPEYAARTAEMRVSAAVLRHFARQEYGHLDVEHRLGEIDRPVLVLSGRHDRTCPADAGEEMVRLIPDAQLVVFERSGHMFFVEEQERFLEVMREFLERFA